MSGMEPVLIGAALGGVSSAVQGGNPLEGALLGGVTGGLGSALAPAATAATTGAETVLGSAAADAAAQNALPGLLESQGIAGLGYSTAAPDLTALGGELAGASNFAGTQQFGPDLTNLAQSIPQAPALGGIPQAPTTIPPQVPSLNNYAYAEEAPGGNLLTASAPSTPSQEQKPGMLDDAWAWAKKNPLPAGMLGLGAISMLSPQPTVPGTTPYQSSFDRNKFKPSLPQNAVYTPRYAEGGGISNLSGSADYENDGIYAAAAGGQMMASGGISSLGSYSDGGRMLKGPGDGMSDSIPASIAGKRPARLADSEFVVPADVVSHLGNGSSDAGAKQLYAMMDRVRKARTGKTKQAPAIKTGKYLPA